VQGTPCTLAHPATPQLGSPLLPPLGPSSPRPSSLALATTTIFPGAKLLPHPDLRPRHLQQLRFFQVFCIWFLPHPDLRTRHLQQQRFSQIYRSFLTQTYVPGSCKNYVFSRYIDPSSSRPTSLAPATTTTLPGTPTLFHPDPNLRPWYLQRQRLC